MIDINKLEADLVDLMNKREIGQLVFVFRDGRSIKIRSLATNPVDAAAAVLIGESVTGLVGSLQGRIIAAMEAAAGNSTV